MLLECKFFLSANSYSIVGCLLVYLVIFNWELMFGKSWNHKLIVLL